MVNHHQKNDNVMPFSIALFVYQSIDPIVSHYNIRHVPIKILSIAVNPIKSMVDRDG